VALIGQADHGRSERRHPSNPTIKSCRSGDSQVKGITDKRRTEVGDPGLARDPALELAGGLAVQKRNPATLMLVKQMANYVQAFEIHLNIIRQADHRCEPATEAGMGHRERSRERRGQCAIAAVSPRKLSSRLLLGRAREPALAVRRARRLDHDAPLAACCRLNVPPKSRPSM
jgi:hypothetical protein